MTFPIFIQLISLVYRAEDILVLASCCEVVEQLYSGWIQGFARWTAHDDVTDVDKIVHSDVPQYQQHNCTDSEVGSLSAPDIVKIVNSSN